MYWPKAGGEHCGVKLTSIAVFSYRKIRPLCFLIHQNNYKVNSVAVVPFLFLDKMQLDLHITSLNAWGMALWDPYKS